MSCMYTLRTAAMVTLGKILLYDKMIVYITLLKCTRSVCDLSDDYCQEIQPRSASSQRENEPIYSLRVRSRSFTLGDELSDYRVSGESKVSVDLSLDCANKRSISSERQSKECFDNTTFLSTNAAWDWRTVMKKACPTEANIRPLSERPSERAQQRKKGNTYNKPAYHGRGKRRRRPRPYCKKHMRQRRVKKKSKAAIANAAKVRDISFPDQAPSHTYSSQTPLKPFTSSPCTSKDAGTGKGSSTATVAACKPRRSDQEHHGVPRKKKCYRAYSDNTPANEKSPTANCGATEYMTSGKVHGRATVNRDIHTCVRENVIRHIFTCIMHVWG